MDNVLYINDFKSNRENKLKRNPHEQSHSHIKEIIKIIENIFPRIQKEKGRDTGLVLQSTLEFYRKNLETDALFSQLDPEYTSTPLKRKLSLITKNINLLSKVFKENYLYMLYISELKEIERLAKQSEICYK